MTWTVAAESFLPSTHYIFLSITRALLEWFFGLSSDTDFKQLYSVHEKCYSSKEIASNAGHISRWALIAKFSTRETRRERCVDNFYFIFPRKIRVIILANRNNGHLGRKSPTTGKRARTNSSDTELLNTLKYAPTCFHAISTHLNNSLRKHPKPLHVATSAVYVTVIVVVVWSSSCYR